MYFYDTLNLWKAYYLFDWKIHMRRGIWMENFPSVNPAPTNKPRILSETESDGYIRLTRRSSYAMGLGVMLIACSPITLIVLYILAANGWWMSENMATMAGLIALFVLAGFAAGLFIYNSVKLHKYEYIKTEPFILEDATLAHIREQAAQHQAKASRNIIVGIAFCILSLIPVLATEAFFMGDEVKTAISIGLLFFIAGIGLFIIVSTEFKSNGYKVLLQEGAHTQAKKSIDNTMLKKISLVFWPLILVVYLIWSFLSGAWGVTWIIWPSAGALYYVILSVCSSFLLYKK